MIEAIRLEEWEWQREREKKFEVKGISRGGEKSEGKKRSGTKVYVHARVHGYGRENRGWEGGIDG